MIIKLYSVKDKLVGFGGPIAFKEDEIAKRWFVALLKQKKDNEYAEYNDYELYCVGSMDTEKGNIIGTALTEVKLIMKGEELDGIQK